MLCVNCLTLTLATLHHLIPDPLRTDAHLPLSTSLTLSRRRRLATMNPTGIPFTYAGMYGLETAEHQHLAEQYRAPAAAGASRKAGGGGGHETGAQLKQLRQKLSKLVRKPRSSREFLRSRPGRKASALLRGETDTGAGRGGGTARRQQSPNRLPRRARRSGRSGGARSSERCSWYA